MNYFGAKLRQLREDQGMLLRQMAAQMDIDTALLSKIERGDRRANRELVEKAADVLAHECNDLLVLWLADKIEDVIDNEPMAAKAIDLITKEAKK
jgi:transcriptional regulator with XRE-family HTH domain